MYWKTWPIEWEKVRVSEGAPVISAGPVTASPDDVARYLIVVFASGYHSALYSTQRAGQGDTAQALRTLGAGIANLIATSQFEWRGQTLSLPAVTGPMLVRDYEQVVFRRFLRELPYLDTEHWYTLKELEAIAVYAAVGISYVLPGDHRFGYFLSYQHFMELLSPSQLHLMTLRLRYGGS